MDKATLLVSHGIEFSLLDSFLLQETLQERVANRRYRIFEPDNDV